MLNTNKNARPYFITIEAPNKDTFTFRVDTELRDKFQLRNIIINAIEKGGQVQPLANPDFWRTFTRKLTLEYETVCINSRLAQNDLAKRVLEPIIDALIKTEQELDSQAKNSG